MSKLEQTWRWYGPDDPVTLNHVRQAGATGIVTALHHIPIGEVWPLEEIEKRKSIIEASGLRWSVIESLPVHEDVKTQTGDFQVYIDRYKASLENIGKCGLQILCYNFMPALDWTRTSLNEPFSDGSTALKFDIQLFAAFDIHILQRTGADREYSQEIIEQAGILYKNMSPNDIEELTSTIVAGLPGTDQHFGLPEFRNAIEKYRGIDEHKYRDHVKYFLEQVIPVARANGIKMAIHPDDPPYDILGLPRIISDEQDVRDFLSLYPDQHNGLTFCTGSFGARLENELPDMIEEFAESIHFVHLRNVSNSGPKTFVEDNHLEGNTDMYEVIKKLIDMKKDHDLPYRPDHGHRMLDDLSKKVNPGYSAIGRLRGLAELRGLELGIRRSQS
ncbi:MAG: mannonate dehydratase [Cyclobacteriaceae bacterium]|nr:mannonate dehydratase [Cyclobacteriaceae bacterium HetDA_MAG_MS6]